MDKASIKVKIINESKDPSLKEIRAKKSKADVEILFCFRHKKTSAKNTSYKIFTLPSKQDFTIIKPQVSQDILEKVQRAIDEKSFLAEDQQVLTLRDCGINTKHTLVIGLGDLKGFDQKQEDICLETFRRMGAIAFQSLALIKARTARLSLHHFDLFPKKTNQVVQAFLLGFQLSSYKFEEHLSKKSTIPFEELSFVQYSSQSSKSTQAALQNAIVQTLHVSEGVMFARWLGDQPGNIINPVTLAQEVQKKFKKTAVKVTVWDKARIKKERMGLLYGVGQGSAIEPRLIVMEYKNKEIKGKVAPVCFVGKGITFDSGGISIKPSPSMEEMKYDMCGGADVIGTMLALEKLQAKVHVIGIVAAAENMPGGSATKPGDIHYARNGLSVEVFNTDAEGRLALGDALCLAVEKKPQFIVDAATLTGAIVVALGNHHTGYFVQGEDFAKDIEKALEATQENAWRMPLVEGHRKSMKGIHADLKNIGDNGNRGAGSAKGAAFLSYFVDDIPWVHFDIAGTAWNVGHLYPYCPKKGASGLMVRTFCQLAMNSF